jgi:hypothetical protein
LKKEFLTMSTDAYKKAIRASGRAMLLITTTYAAGAGKPGPGTGSSRVNWRKAAPARLLSIGGACTTSNLGRGARVITGHMQEAAPTLFQERATEAKPDFGRWLTIQLGAKLWIGQGHTVDPQTGAMGPPPGTPKEALPESDLDLAPTGPNAPAATSLIETLNASVYPHTVGNHKASGEERIETGAPLLKLSVG